MELLEILNNIIKMPIMFYSCTYRFEANPGEVVRLRVWGVRSGGRLCRSVHSAHSPWFRCAGDITAAVRVFDRPWKNSGPGVPRDCLCRYNIKVLYVTSRVVSGTK
jgi:hypothetical protein